MEVNIVKDEKDNLVVNVDNQTIAELLRVYLNKDSSVELGVWKRDDPNKPVTLEVKTSGKAAKKALSDAVAAAEKDINKYLAEFKKA